MNEELTNQFITPEIVFEKNPVDYLEHELKQTVNVLNNYNKDVLTNEEVTRQLKKLKFSTMAAIARLDK